jgi:phage shock protein PspC (stress-responsive transcriptional regulator)
MLGGICGGIAEKFNWDPSLVRLGLVFLCLITGVIPLVLTYFVAWVIVPETPVDKT